MHSFIRPNQFVAVKLPSDQTRIVKIVPDTIVSLGKYGNFAANQIIGRPLYFTFEILDSRDESGYQLRVVTATELHAETLLTEGEGDGDDIETGEDGVPMRTNRETIDERSTQKLTVEEIEELKKEAGGAGREIVAKLLESHTALDQKTAFSLAKYTLRKRKKYMKRFTVYPLDVSLLANFLLEERDASKSMELRDEHIGLIGCWGNVHHSGNVEVEPGMKPHGRYFIVDETGGLVVAAMAERMGILYPHDAEEDVEEEEEPVPQSENTEETPDETAPKQRRIRPQPMSATTNTITVVHAYSQPNLSLLKYFGYDTNNPDESHPLHTHLKTISWMQLVDPNSDPLYTNEPPALPAEELTELKQSKRTSYYHKRNRWERVKNVVDESRAGDFDGLVVSSLLDPASILKTLVPLLAGSAPIAIYSPTVESLVQLTDMYSTARRTAFIHRKREMEESTPRGETPDLSSLYEEFVVDPTLILPPTLQTSRIRPWQVLPGRTHPLMMGRGGAEGYLFHGIRVFPTTQNIQAAGNIRKRRKIDSGPASASTPISDQDVEMTPFSNE